jgi:hypothetical protein
MASTPTWPIVCFSSFFLLALLALLASLFFSFGTEQVSIDCIRHVEGWKFSLLDHLLVYRSLHVAPGGAGLPRCEAPVARHGTFLVSLYSPLIKRALLSGILLLAVTSLDADYRCFRQTAAVLDRSEPHFASIGRMHLSEHCPPIAKPLADWTGVQ